VVGAGDVDGRQPQPLSGGGRDGSRVWELMSPTVVRYIPNGTWLRLIAGAKQQPEQETNDVALGGRRQHHDGDTQIVVPR
jgi:hypothetical protein